MGKAYPTALDLFSGAGGMSLGFRQAGFRVVGAFDVERRHVETYKRNHARCAALEADLGTASGPALLKACGVRRVDVVFGGPPCQGFSVGGKRSAHDERNALLQHFARLVTEIRPRYFVMENVHGLLMNHAADAFGKFLSRMEAVGYSLGDGPRLLNAVDFGVPQRRKRTFVIGSFKGETQACLPASVPLYNEDGKGYFPTVWDAIRDLPKIERYESLFEKDGYNGKLGRPSHYGRVMRGEAKDHNDRLPTRKTKLKSLTGCLRTMHSAQTVKRFTATKPGTADPISRYYRLSKNGVAPTIRAGTGDDHGRHTSPRPIHPEVPRCITVREAARLHSYPDWFQFHSTRWHAFRQIGNSVPPRLARCVAHSVHEALN